MRKQFEREGLLTPKERFTGTKDIIAGRIPGQISLYGKTKSLRSIQRSAYGFVDDFSKEGKPKRKKGGLSKRRNPFGKIKDRSITQGFF